jgi:predicted RNase H-like HicB family nuclease
MTLPAETALSPARRGTTIMQTVRYIYWEQDGGWLGYLEEYPDYWTQGETLDDLMDHLKDLFHDLSGNLIPGARRVGKLIIS